MSKARPRAAAAARDRTHPNAAAFPPGLSGPALRALAAAGLTRLDDLTRVRERDLRALHGMGPRALDVLWRALADQGRTFAAE